MKPVAVIALRGFAAAYHPDAEQRSAEEGEGSGLGNLDLREIEFEAIKSSRAATSQDEKLKVHRQS